MTPTHAWLCAHQTLMEPLAAEVWVIGPDVQLRPARAAPRARMGYRLAAKSSRARCRGQPLPVKLVEEAGVAGELLPVPAAVAVRSFRVDWVPTLSLSYGAVVSRDVPQGGESGQPSTRVDLDETWESVVPKDRERIRAYVRRLAAGNVIGAY